MIELENVVEFAWEKWRRDMGWSKTNRFHFESFRREFISVHNQIHLSFAEYMVIGLRKCGFPDDLIEAAILEIGKDIRLKATCPDGFYNPCDFRNPRNNGEALATWQLTKSIYTRMTRGN